MLLPFQNDGSFNEHLLCMVFMACYLVYFSVRVISSKGNCSLLQR